MTIDELAPILDYSMYIYYKEICWVGLFLWAYVFIVVAKRLANPLRRLYGIYVSRIDATSTFNDFIFENALKLKEN